MNQERFKVLLESVLAPDTARVKEATAELKKDYYTSPESLGLLLQLLVSQPSPQLRQLAATQARSLIPRHWAKIPDSHKPEVRSRLLESSLHEQNRTVRHATARVIAAIAKTDVADGEWADLPGQMVRVVRSSGAQEREVGTYILFSILEDMAEDHLSQFPALFQLFGQTIHDPESAEVRINTLLALSKMALVIDAGSDEASLASFQEALPAMVQVLKQVIDAKDEERTMQTFECFQTLLDADGRLLNKHFRDLMQFMATIVANAEVDKEARTQALNLMISALMYRRLKFQSLRIGDQMASLLIGILVGDEQTDETRDDEFSLTLSALSMISLMASQLPPSQIVVPIINIFKKYAVSPDLRQRQASISALATCVEGAPEFVDTQLPELLPLILRLLNDPEIKVREAAVSGCKELAETLPEALAKEHQKFMAGLAKNLNASVQHSEGAHSKTNLNIAVHCCTAIDHLVTGLEPEQISQYLPELVPHLRQLFSHPDIKIRSSAIGAVGSIAAAAKSSFLPYFGQTMNDLSGYIHLKDNEDEMTCRSITIDAMGDMATAVGPDSFKQYVRPLMEATEEGLHLDNQSLKETSYMFWGILSKVYAESFSPFLDGITKGIFEALTQEESDIEVEVGEAADDLIGQEVILAGRKIIAVKDGLAEKDMDDSGSDSGSDWDDVTGVSPIAEEKEVALEALAEILTHTGTDFLPYFEQAIKVIMPLVNHSYEATRRAAISGMFRAFAALWQLQPEAQRNWIPGLPLKSQPTKEVADLAELVMTATIEAYSDLNSEIIMELNRNLGDTLKACGPFLISGENKLQQITQPLLQVINKEHTCQEEFEDDDFQDEESSEDDWYVIETAMDTIAGLAAALGPQFAELWKMFEKPFLQYASATSPNQRGCTIGSLADCIKGMKEGVTPYTTHFLKLLLHRLADEDNQVKSNAAFAIGILVEHTQKTQEATKAYPVILQKLEPLLHTQESRQLDNAAGCVARLIMKHPDRVPLDEVLPALVGLLPLKTDYEENAPVWSMVVGMYKGGNTTIHQLTPQIVPVLEKVLGPPDEQLEEKTRTELVQLVGYLHSKQPALLKGHELLEEIATS